MNLSARGRNRATVCSTPAGSDLRRGERQTGLSQVPVRSVVPVVLQEGVDEVAPSPAITGTFQYDRLYS